MAEPNAGRVLLVGGASAHEPALVGGLAGTRITVSAVAGALRARVFACFAAPVDEVKYLS